MARLIVAAAGAALGAAFLPAGLMFGAFSISGSQLGWMAGPIVGGIYAPAMPTKPPDHGVTRKEKSHEPAQSLDL